MGALLGAFREPHTLRTAKAIIPLSCEATAGGGGAELIREFTRVLSVFCKDFVGSCRILEGFMGFSVESLKVRRHKAKVEKGWCVCVCVMGCKGCGEGSGC